MHLFPPLIVTMVTLLVSFVVVLCRYSFVTNTPLDATHNHDSPVPHDHFHALLVYYCYFSIFFNIFDGLAEAHDMEIDLVKFKKVVDQDLNLLISPAQLAGDFDALDSNDGNGNVMVDEVCVWYARQQCPLGTAVAASFPGQTIRPGGTSPLGTTSDSPSPSNAVSTVLSREATFTPASGNTNVNITVPGVETQQNPAMTTTAAGSCTMFAVIFAWLLGRICIVTRSPCVAIP